MADVNSEGQLASLINIFQQEPWYELWTALGLEIQRLDRLGLQCDASDADVWRTCQDRQLILVTSNRNQDGPDSLEAMIRNHNTPSSLPVITLADPQQIVRDRLYAERAAVRLLDYLIEMDRVRGAGRLYVP